MTRRQFERLIEPLRVILLLGSLMFLTFETYWLENTIQGLRLFWVSFGIGCLVGLIPSAVFGYFHHDLIGGLVGPVTRVSQFAMLTALTFGLLFPAGASMLNRKVATAPAHRLPFVVTEKCLGGKARSTPYLFLFSSPGASERIEVDRPFFDRISVGAEISLTLIPGVLGYEVVHEWSAPNPPLQGTLRDEAPRP